MGKGKREKIGRETKKYEIWEIKNRKMRNERERVIEKETIKERDFG
mgnify:CR=1 FL=1